MSLTPGIYSQDVKHQSNEFIEDASAGTPAEIESLGVDEKKLLRKVYVQYSICLYGRD